MSYENENEKPFVCSRCPSKFVKKSNLTKHITAVHEKKMPFMCSICPSKFSFKRIESVEDWKLKTRQNVESHWRTEENRQSKLCDGFRHNWTLHIMCSVIALHFHEKKINFRQSIAWYTVFPRIVSQQLLFFGGLGCDNYSKETTIQGRKLLISCFLFVCIP